MTSHNSSSVWYCWAVRPLILPVLAVAAISGVAQEKSGVYLDLSPPKLDCNHLDFLREGKPVFFGSMDGLRLGISTRKATVSFGEPVKVDLWVDNRSDKPTWSGGRCPTFLHFGDVFDESGRRVIGIVEQATIEAERKGGTIIQLALQRPWSLKFLRTLAKRRLTPARRV